MVTTKNPNEFREVYRELCKNLQEDCYLRLAKGELSRKEVELILKG